MLSGNDFPGKPTFSARSCAKLDKFGKEKLELCEFVDTRNAFLFPPLSLLFTQLQDVYPSPRLRFSILCMLYSRRAFVFLDIIFLVVCSSMFPALDVLLFAHHCNLSKPVTLLFFFHNL